MNPRRRSLSVAATPTIKGVFVNSHARAVRRDLGDAGVAAMALRTEQIRFGAREDVPISVEVAVIEAALDVLEPHTPPRLRDERAGRLHFRDFTATPWASFLFRMFPKDVRFMMLHGNTIATRVFRHVRMESTEAGPGAVRVRMENTAYPLEHFRGLILEWMEHFGQAGTVIGQETAPGCQEFVVRCT